MGEDASGSAQPNVLRGWAHQQGGQVELAEAAYRRAVALHEPDAEAYLGDLLIDRGRPAEAVPVLEQGLQRGDVDCHVLLGNALADAGRTADALEQYTAAAESGDVGGWHNLGMLLRSLGRIDDASAAWRKSYEAGFTLPAVFASLLADAGAPDEAIEVLEASAARGDADALVEIGAIEQGRGRLAEAERVLRLALERGAPEAFVYLASVLKRTGRADEARQVLSQGAELGVGSAELQLANDLSAVDIHDPEVEPLYRRAIDHGDDEAVTNLGVHLLEVGRAAEGVELLERAAGAGDRLAARTLIEHRSES